MITQFAFSCHVRMSLLSPLIETNSLFFFFFHLYFYLVFHDMERFWRIQVCFSVECPESFLLIGFWKIAGISPQNITSVSVSVQSLSRVRLFATPRIAACQASLSITNSQSSLSFTFIESVMPSSHLILCRPLLLLPPIPPSNKVFSNESTLCMRWPKYWSFSFSIIPSKEIPGLISFRMDWLDLLAVQEYHMRSHY